MHQFDDMPYNPPSITSNYDCLPKNQQNIPSNNNISAWFNAIYSGSKIDTNDLIINGENVDQTDGDGWTALMRAADKGYLDLVQLLLNNGAEVNKKHSYTDETALMWAAEKGHLSIVQLLLDHGAVDYSDSTAYDPDTALLWAVYNNRLNVVELLLRKSKKCINTTNDYGINPLYCAIETENLDMVKLLISSGADANYIRGDETMLIAATRMGQIETAKLLLDAGAKIDEPDATGKTPLMQGIENGLFDIVELLIDHGADINKSDQYNETALMWALQPTSCYDYNIIQLLLTRGANIDQTNTANETVLSLANTNNKVSNQVEKLLKLGSFKYQNLIGNTDASYPTIASALQDYFKSPYMHNIRRLMREPLKELKQSILHTLLIYNRITNKNSALPQLPFEIWLLIIKNTYNQEFTLRNGTLSRCFYTGNSHTQKLATIPPQLSKHINLKLHLTNQHPVILKTVDVEGLGFPLVARFGW